MSAKDTIVALSTAMGESAIAVVRLSGPLCKEIACSVFAKKSLLERHTYLGWYRNLNGSKIDQVLFVFFDKGKSYTGEPMLEISCHGNPLISEKVIKDLVHRGCRCAEPGEFTREAFLNGSLDLCQAEAVAELIHAKNEHALSIAGRQLDGSMSNSVSALSEKLIESSALINACLDFAEEDELDGSLDVHGKLNSVLDEIESFLELHKRMNLVKDGFSVVIAGPPNAGKSTLLNRLLRQQRAIVSNKPGTTRDFIAENLRIGGHLIRIIDTAGVHFTTDELESCGIDQTYKQLDKADIAILVLDRSDPGLNFQENLKSRLNPENTLVLINKIDLPNGLESLSFLDNFNCVESSLHDEEKYVDFENRLIKFLDEKLSPLADVPFMVNARHASAFSEAKNFVNNAISTLTQNNDLSLVDNEIQYAVRALESIIGKVDYENVLGSIFSKFCIGK